VPAAPSPKSAPTEAEVRRKLKASKLSQAELARLTGIDAAMLSRFRSGKKSMSAENLKRLADELG
jgi:transcriptional regulator with XRE-family HTH domain